VTAAARQGELRARPGEAPVVVGIDVASSRPCTAVALRGGRTLDVLEWREADEREPGDRGRLFAWLDGLAPLAVGVDAPQRPKRALPGGARHSRRCDAELLARRIAVYQVPTAAEAGAREGRYAWMHAGWAYFKELGRRGYERPADGRLPGALGQAPAALEVYPHAGFVTLLGGTPPAKSTREGLRLRVLTLRRLGLRWDEYFDHDSLDALMAAFTAWRFCQGLASGLGDDRDGRVWVPVPAADLKASYPRLSPHEARARLPNLTAG
jgi:predicted nuclease with RNAse H fold